MTELLLLKALVKQTIQVPGYTKRDGTWVDAHTKIVNVDPSKSKEDVLAGKGNFSQQKAHKKLSKLPHWHTLSPDEQHAHILSAGHDIQQKETAAAQTVVWKKKVLAGQEPTKATMAAVLAMPVDKRAVFLAGVWSKMFKVGSPSAPPPKGFWDVYHSLDHQAVEVFNAHLDGADTVDATINAIPAVAKNKAGANKPVAHPHEALENSPPSKAGFGEQNEGEVFETDQGDIDAFSGGKWWTYNSAEELWVEIQAPENIKDLNNGVSPGGGKPLATAAGFEGP